MPETYAYRSRDPFEEGRIHAAAIYCSDGRFGDQLDEFLHQGLRLPRYDRLACPGGPVVLAGRLHAYWESRGVEEQLAFLVRAHNLQQVILIAHEACAYYRLRLQIPPARLEQEQLTDLQKATWAVRRIDPRLEVRSYLARVVDSRVVFQVIPSVSGDGGSVQAV